LLKFIKRAEQPIAALLDMWIEIASSIWAEAKDEQDAKRIKEKYKDYKKKQGDNTSRHFIVGDISNEFNGII